MHKIFGSRIVFMCIFALTHHLPTTSARASDLSLSTISSSLSSSSPFSSHMLTSNSVTFASAKAAVAADIATTKSSGALTETAAFLAIENDDADVAAIKEISIAAQSSLSSSSSLQPSGYQEKLATSRQTRSLYNTYPYSKFYSGYGGGTYYYPYSSYSYAYSPSFYKYWSAYNLYNGYPRVIYG